jgi:CubicO group peptidase (beta-lactamase class C family)
MNTRYLKQLSLIIIALLLIPFSIVHAFENSDIDSMINHHMTDSNIPGIATAIIKNGEIIYLDARGNDGKGKELSNSTPMFIGSISKSLTALATMQLVEKNLIALEDPIKKYIPYFKVASPTLTQNITVKDLLYQRSGLSRKKSIPSSDYDFSIKQRVKALSDMKEVSDNGEEFHYLNDNYNILGLLIEEVSGKTYAKYMKKNVFNPIGMVNTTADVKSIRQKNIYGHTNIFGFTKKIKQSVPRYDIPSGYIVSNIKDMNSYMYFLLDSDESVLSKESIELMRRVSGKSNYAMGWHINKVDNLTLVEHSGAVPGFSSHMAIIPETNSGYIYIMNKNHLIHNFVKVYEKVNSNLLKVLMGGDSFEYFPSIWIIRITSILIISLTVKDVWNTRKFISDNKKRKEWLKEGIKSILLILFLIFGLSFILKDILGLGYDLKIMFSYAPDFTFLLIVAILVQVVRLFISVIHLFNNNANETPLKSE